MSLHTDHRALVAVALTGFLTLTLVVAVLPALDIQKIPPHADLKPPTQMELLGRDLYLRDGCGFCHTQFVRDLAVDKPYGRGSVAEDYALEAPPLLGTQRTGPDLANVGIRQPSEVWNLIHLYNPRAVMVIPLDTSIKHSGKGLQSQKVYESVLNPDQVQSLAASPEPEPFHGDPVCREF
ncbi:MAG: cbb3-type cytochrome c oxidase subunit II [Chromatiales bacterium]